MSDIPPVDIPEQWPPPLTSTPVPLFPLPGVFLFPRHPLPLHIFEPRYRAMIEDSLDGPGRIVLGTIPIGEEETSEHVPKILDVATLGEIARHDRLDDGRFMIILFGLQRVEWSEVESPHPYRLVQVSAFSQNEPAPPLAHSLDQRLRQALQARMGEDFILPGDTPLEFLIDLLCSRLALPAARVERIFTERDQAVRAERVLAAHQEAT